MKKYILIIAILCLFLISTFKLINLSISYEFNKNKPYGEIIETQKLKQTILISKDISIDSISYVRRVRASARVLSLLGRYIILKENSNKNSN